MVKNHFITCDFQIPIQEIDHDQCHRVEPVDAKCAERQKLPQGIQTVNVEKFVGQNIGKHLLVILIHTAGKGNAGAENSDCHGDGNPVRLVDGNGAVDFSCRGPCRNGWVFCNGNREMKSLTAVDNPYPEDQGQHDHAGTPNGSQKGRCRR